MGGVVTKEKAIIQSQYLDLVYSQSKTLYDLIHQAPRPSTDPAKTLVEVPVDGIVGSIQSPSGVKLAKQNQTVTPTPLTPKVSTEVNSIRSTQTSGNNKNKGKNKGKRKRPTNSDNDKGKRKEKYPCLL